MFRIAIQSKGRLSEASQNYLRTQGYEFNRQDRELITRCQNRDAEILFLRSSDISEYVSRGAADMGIVGENVLKEKRSKCLITQKLNFAICRLDIAVPQNSDATSITDLEGERIATTYPNLLSDYLKQNNIRASIIPIQGSVEIAPLLNMADAICDLVQTGKTMAVNGLRSLATIMESQAVLITKSS